MPDSPRPPAQLLIQFMGLGDALVMHGPQASRPDPSSPTREIPAIPLSVLITIALTTSGTTNPAASQAAANDNAEG